MFTLKQYENLKKAVGPQIVFKKRRGVFKDKATPPPKNENKGLVPFVRPKKRCSGFKSRDISQSGPKFINLSGAYEMLAFIREPKIDRGYYTGARRERQTDLINRRYRIFEGS